MQENRFPCTKEGMVAAQAFLEELCPSPKPSIVADEIISNIVRCSGATYFTLAFDQTAAGVTLVFTDDGMAFDPTQDIPTPDVAATIEERCIGGLGIFMVKKMSKKVTYRREGGVNRLEVAL